MPHLSAFAKALIQPRRSGSGARVKSAYGRHVRECAKGLRCERAQRNTAPAAFAVARP